MAAKVLIAEDNADTREALRLSLELEGYAVRVAANGDEALRLQMMESADVLVTDLFMPDRDGFETLLSFRNYFPSTKIVVISGGAETVRGSYLESARLVGADATLRKPISPPDLLRIIAGLLKAP
jgi:CheY-like chemotaxis protein